MPPVLQVNNVSQRFSGTTVLGGVSFEMDAGERLAVIGSSGSGKTTLLRLIAGLESPTAGKIEIAGRCVSRDGRAVVAPEHRGVAMVFQGLALFPHLRALDQIAFAAKGPGGLDRAKALLDRIGLSRRATARLDELSGGERQRIALARAMAQQPRLILMDEPFSSLDDQKRIEMRDLLRSLLDTEQTTLILVTHSRDDALDLAQRTIVLEDGKAVAQGTLESILQTPRHAAAVRAFGLGQIITARGNSNGTAETPFAMIEIAIGLTGPLQVLIRPAQPILNPTDGRQTIEAEVFRIELRPPDSAHPSRTAVVRVGDHQLRVFIGAQSIHVGDRVQLRIDGRCDVLE